MKNFMSYNGNERNKERQESVSVDRLKPAKAEPDSTIEPAMPPRRGHPTKGREERPAARREQDDPETEQRPPTYAQVTRRGREIRPPDRYVAATDVKSQATMH